MQNLPFDPFPTLFDENLLLREVLYADMHALWEISFYDGQPARSAEEAWEMQKRINADYAAGNSVHWAIVDAVTQSVVGTCGYYRGFEAESGELGCVLLPQYRQKGFMTTALWMAIQYGFDTLGLKSITALTHKENARAIRLLERLGFVKELAGKDDLIIFAKEKGPHEAIKGSS